MAPSARPIPSPHAGQSQTRNYLSVPFDHALSSGMIYTPSQYIFLPATLKTITAHLHSVVYSNKTCIIAYLLAISQIPYDYLLLPTYLSSTPSNRYEEHPT